MPDRDGTDPQRLKMYATLVNARRACRLCDGLQNPSECSSGIYDSDQIGPWSRWQGNLKADLLIVGQDWGDTAYFKKSKGYEPKQSRTNGTLMVLLNSVGVELSKPLEPQAQSGTVFMTNAVLCLKSGGAQATVSKSWFANCGPEFLKPTIDLIAPKVVVSLGIWAYRTVATVYSLPQLAFRCAVEQPVALRLNGRTAYVPVYHCGARILNTHRSMQQQIRDWHKVRNALEESPNL